MGNLQRMKALMLILSFSLYLTSCASLQQGKVFTPEERGLIANVKVIRVVVKQSYEEADKVSLPFFKVTKKILKYGGFEVVGETSETYDATLSINAKGTPLGAWYSYSGIGRGEYRYSGARIKGDILLSLKDRKFKWTFAGEVDPPYSISAGSYLSPNNAPFGEVFSDEFCSAMMRVLADFKGIEPLLSALKDKDSDVREGVVNALGKIKDPRAVEPLISALKEEYWRVREEAAKALGKIKDPRAVEPLISALKEEYWRVREGAAEALKEIKDPRAVEPLISALKDKDWRVREEAAKALGEINPKWMETEEAKRKVPEFISALKDKDGGVREAAFEALGKINPKWRETEEAKRKVPEFISALKDKDWSVRGAAAIVLGEIKDPRAVEPLISALKDKDEDWYVRYVAAKALGKIKDPQTVELLISALKNKDVGVRWGAAYALGEIKDPRTVKPLISALKDEDWNVREEAAKALKKITGQDFGEDQKRWQSWWEENKGKYLK